MESRWGRVSRSGFPSSARQFYRPPIKHRARLQQQAQRHYCQRWEARLRAETTLMMGWIAECLGMGTRGHLNHLLYRRRKPGGEQPLSRTVYGHALPAPWAPQRRRAFCLPSGCCSSHASSRSMFSPPGAVRPRRHLPICGRGAPMAAASLACDPYSWVAARRRLSNFGSCCFMCGVADNDPGNL